MSAPRLAAASAPPDEWALPEADLGAIAAAGIPKPGLLAGGMLYRGAVHCLAGQPGGGKTTVMAHWLLAHLRDGGSVMLLDEESGPELAAEKLLDLGASPAELSPPRLTYVPFPARNWGPADLGRLHELITARQPGIIGWDSAAAFLAIAGRDENSAQDVTAFWHRVLVPCARQHGAAVVAIDHTGKGEHGGYGRGSGAKKAASDVQYIVETVRPFSRSQDGVLRLTTAPGKDRRGYLPVSCEIHVRTSGGLRLEFTEAATPETAEPEMPPARAKLLEALRALSPAGEAVTVAQLVDEVARVHGHGLKRPTCSTHLNALARAGLADSADPGPGREKLWSATAGPPRASGPEATAPPHEGAYLARRNPDLPDPKPPCRHEHCWNALAGRCLDGTWPDGSAGAEANR